jgi:hypothetical protein
MLTVHALTMLLLWLVPPASEGRPEKPPKQPGGVEIEVRIFGTQPGKSRKTILLAGPEVFGCFGERTTVRVGGDYIPVPAGLQQGVGVIFEEYGLRVNLLGIEVTGGRVRVEAEIECRELHPPDWDKPCEAQVQAVKVVRLGDAFSLKVPKINGMSHLVEFRVVKRKPLNP